MQISTKHSFSGAIRYTEIRSLLYQNTRRIILNQTVATNQCRNIWSYMLFALNSST